MASAKGKEWAKRDAESRTVNGIQGLAELMMAGRDDVTLRKINPTQAAYLYSDEKFKAYMGPAGSGKSVVGCTEIMLKALLMPGTKWFVARRDYNDLMDTTLRTMSNILQNLPDGTLIDRTKAAPQKWIIRPMQIAGATDGPLPPSEITFMGLSDDVGSYEFTGGFIDEADEVEQRYYEQLKGRLRWRPSRDFPDSNFSIGMAFNPPSVTHWLYLACEGKNPEGEQVKPPTIKLFRPVYGENAHNLRSGYYEDMAATMPAELRRRLVEGDWGSGVSGDAVIRQFNRDMHVGPVTYRPGATMIRMWDWGYRRPACIWAQLAKDGRLEILAEYLGNQIEGKAFVENVLAQTTERFPNATKFLDYGDPAVAQHKDTGSMLSILFDAGVQIRYMRTPFDVSLQIVRQRFEKLIEGVPAVRINPNCRILIDGLAGGYHLDEDGIKPVKDNTYDHLIDALRYGIWAIYGVNAFMRGAEGQPKNIAYWQRGL
ncbi:MAG: phage terminase large subunit [Solirubrobacterales bacterium]